MLAINALQKDWIFYAIICGTVLRNMDKCGFTHNLKQITWKYNYFDIYLVYYLWSSITFKSGISMQIMNSLIFTYLGVKMNSGVWALLMTFTSQEI